MLTVRRNRELEMLDMRNRVPPSANAKPPAQAKAAAASPPPANSGPGGRPKPQPKPAPVQSTVLQQQASLGKSCVFRAVFAFLLCRVCSFT